MTATLGELRDELVSGDEQGREIDGTDLPTFGGTDPRDSGTSETVWSWDATHALVGKSFEAHELRIVPRNEL